MPGSQADDQQACIPVAEWRYRPAVIAGIFFGNFVEESCQSRALAAIYIKRILVIHVPDYGVAESFGADQGRTRDQLLEFADDPVDLSWGRALRIGWCIASRSLARSNVSSLLAMVLATPFMM